MAHIVYLVRLSSEWKSSTVMFLGSSFLRLTKSSWIICRNKPKHDYTLIWATSWQNQQVTVRPVWSESSLCAQWVPKDPSFLHADSKDSDQTGQMPRLIWVFAGCTCHFICFVIRWLNYPFLNTLVYWLFFLLTIWNKTVNRLSLFNL